MRASVGFGGHLFGVSVTAPLRRLTGMPRSVENLYGNGDLVFVRAVNARGWGKMGPDLAAELPYVIRFGSWSHNNKDERTKEIEMRLNETSLARRWAVTLFLLMVPIAWAQKHGSSAPSRPAPASHPSTNVSRPTTTHPPAATMSRPSATTAGRTFGTTHTTAGTTHSATPATTAGRTFGTTHTTAGTTHSANPATTSHTTGSTTHTLGATTHSSTTTTHTPGQTTRTTSTTTHTPGQTTRTTSTTTHTPGMTTRTTTTTRTFSNGTTARVGPGGHVQSIHTAGGATITRTSAGTRTIVATHNGRTIVSTGRGAGFVERPYLNRGGRVYVQRTYVVGGRRYAYVYGRYPYHGVYFYHYAPAFYYRPAFYGWAYNPWVSPVYYHWGWFGAPWYAPYGYYFVPAPYYPVASLWLTDYLLAQTLQSAYEAQAAANVAAAQAQQGQAPPPQAQNAVLTPEIKQAIAEEVKRQLDAERAAGANPAQPSTAPASEQAPPALDPATRVFVVSNTMDVTSGDQACSLGAGDVITRIDDTPDANQNVNVLVTSSKRADCPMGQKVAVAVQDLQEMHNHFREQIDSGLKTLADNQGKNGLPHAPDTRTSSGEVPPPSPDDVQADLQKQEADADQTEKSVTQQVSASGQG